MKEFDANKALDESKKAPDLMAERKPLNLQDKPEGNPNNPSTWSI